MKSRYWLRSCASLCFTPAGGIQPFSEGLDLMPWHVVSFGILGESVFYFIILSFLPDHCNFNDWFECEVSNFLSCGRNNRYVDARHASVKDGRKRRKEH